MTRPRKRSDDDLLDGALEAVAAKGKAAGITDVTAALGAPVGSIYYRYPSRDHLMVSLWLRSVRRFQEGLLALPGDDAQSALEGAARHVIAYCRAHPAEARALTLYRQQVLLAQAPPDLRQAVEHLNDEIWERMRRLTTKRYGRATAYRIDLVRIAVQQSPYGLVRPFIGAEDPIPGHLEAVAVAAARAILALGE